MTFMAANCKLRQASQISCWVQQIRLVQFRNYERLSLVPGARSVVLVGENGAGKTNLLEAVSLLAPGRGIRRAALTDIARDPGNGDWTMWGELQDLYGQTEIGTGLTQDSAGNRRRQIRLNGTHNISAQELGDFCQILWLTPSMDGLFTGASGERRLFVDRLAASVFPGHFRHLRAFELLMRQRNTMLSKPDVDYAWLSAIESQMAEHGVALCATRIEAINLLSELMEQRPQESFPGAQLRLEGSLEDDLTIMAALDAEDRYCQVLEHNRIADRAAGRTLHGPHRTDLVIFHANKGRAARHCSTGEQKILLCGLLLAQAMLVKEVHKGRAPILLLDEIGAHLDQQHRQALFSSIAALGAQSWLTGTETDFFAELPFPAVHYSLRNGIVSKTAD